MPDRAISKVVRVRRMGLLVIYALLIFVVFAVVGGLVVRYIVQNQPEPGEGDLPPRGFPRDGSDY